MSPAPPHSTRGLLEGIADSALDDDYYEVRADDPNRPTTRTLISAVGIALFALLITVALVQNRNDKPGLQIERATIVNDIKNRKATLDKNQTQAEKLRSEVASLQALSNNTNPEYETLRMLTADGAATGPGVVVTVDNGDADSDRGRISDIDMQLLVNGLWYAGAEAISINGNRLGSLSSIRKAGEAITVNYRSIVAPYRITALGDTDSLSDRLAENAGGRHWAARVRSSGLRFSIQDEDQLNVPAAPSKRVRILHADSIEGES